MLELIGIIVIVLLMVAYICGVFWIGSKLFDWSNGSILSLGFVLSFIITPIVVAAYYCSDEVQHKNEVCIRSHQEHKSAMLVRKVIVPAHYDLQCDEWETKK